MTGRRSEVELWEVPRFSGLRRGFRPECDCYRTDGLTVTYEAEMLRIEVLVGRRR